MPQPYPPAVTAPQPAMSKLHAQLGERDGWRCTYCPQVPQAAIRLGHAPARQRYQAAEADHLVPRARGGSDAADNRVLACGPCNNAKRADSLLVFLARRAAA